MGRENQLGVIILAAGKASRMGKPKALLPYKGHSFLLNTYHLAQCVKPKGIITVLGHYFDQMSAYCKQYDIPFVFNMEYEQGMSSSIICGLNQLLFQFPSLNGVIILLADQPKIDHAHLSNMISKLYNNSVKMVCTSYKSTYGVPAIFRKDYFNDLLSLEGEKGAKYLIQKHVSFEHNIVLCEEGHIDIDTPDDYIQLIEGEKLSM
jgi:molybdenum cofactor cytidylyltransferase